MHLIYVYLIGKIQRACHQYYCHCSFRSYWNCMKQTTPPVQTKSRWKRQRRPTMFARKKVTRIHVYENKIPSMYCTSFYSHSLVCQHNPKYRHPRHSFIHSNIAFFFYFFLSLNFIYLFFLYSALWRSLAYNTFAMA